MMSWWPSSLVLVPVAYVIYKTSSFIWNFVGFRNWFIDQSCPSSARIDGKVVLITGGNGGIGSETAKELLSRGATVYIACRNYKKAEGVSQKIVKELKDIGCDRPESRLHILTLDLSSLSSVRNCAAKFRRLSDRLDILINNAGVMMCPFHRSIDGFELQMATNHLGHFLLTYLLLDLIVSASPSRIINVSSVGHWLGSDNFDDLTYKNHRYDPTLSYSQSKLANILFTVELDRRLRGALPPVENAERDRLAHVTVNALHPGVVDTQLFRHVWLVVNPVSNCILRPFRYLMEKTPCQGAQTSIFLSVAPEVSGISGRYFANCRFAAVSPHASNTELAKKVWDLSEKLVGITQKSNWKNEL